MKTIIKIPKFKTRVTWALSPISRVKPSKKIYNRKKLDLFS